MHTTDESVLGNSVQYLASHQVDAKRRCLFFSVCRADKGSYQRVGEATELALRVLTEKIGLLGYGSQALDSLSRAERVSYCNDHWQNDYRKVCKLFPVFSCCVGRAKPAVCI